MCLCLSSTATAIFLTTLSFLRTMPGVLQEDHGFPALSVEGQFLAKDDVLLGPLALRPAPLPVAAKLALGGGW